MQARTKRTNQLMALLITLCLLLGLVPVTALAADTTYDLWVGGVQVTSENAKDVLEDGTVSYDVDKNTLTLNNAEITKAYNKQGTGGYWGIRSLLENLTINLQGDNTINFLDAVIYGDNEIFYGIGAENLTITGSGSLEVQSIEWGIRTSEDLVIDGGKINSISNPGRYFSFGVSVGDNLTVNGGTLRGESKREGGKGIWVFRNLTVNSGSVYGNSSGENGIGLEPSWIKLFNGTINGEATGLNSVGVYFDRTMVLEKGSLYAKGVQEALKGKSSENLPIEEMFVGIVLPDGFEFQKVLYGDDYYASVVPVGTKLEVDEKGNLTNAVKEIVLTVSTQPTEYNVRVCGTQVTSENKDDVLGNKDGDKATVRYNPDTNTITLDNAKLTTYSEGVYTWGSGPDFIVELIGENTIGPEQGTPYCGIASRRDLKITGNGSLTTTGLPVGIDTKDVDLFFWRWYYHL